MRAVFALIALRRADYVSNLEYPLTAHMPQLLVT